MVSKAKMLLATTVVHECSVVGGVSSTSSRRRGRRLGL